MKPAADKRAPMSAMKKLYWIRLIFRCAIFILCAVMWRAFPEEFDILQGMNFFRTISPLHLLWGIWMLDMFRQIVPVGRNLALGSRKLFGQYFRPACRKTDPAALRQYIINSSKSAFRVLLVWILLGAAIGGLYFIGILAAKDLFMFTAAFYVADLVCVLIWCPFRLMMKNRCCTTCRIFNWDHLMMFTPMLFIPGFYSRSLFIVSLTAWVIWELNVLRHPERFWEVSNEALQCRNCTEKLCAQYCRNASKERFNEK